jgi:hypothetical protein
MRKEAEAAAAAAAKNDGESFMEEDCEDGDLVGGDSFPFPEFSKSLPAAVSLARCG